MAKYVDGFVIPIRKSRVADYKKIARKACKVWMDHGALAYFESVGEELEPKGMPGVVQTFPKLARTRTGETVIFAWVLYKSKAHRNAVNKKVLADKRITDGPTEMPFDMKRMSVGGFSVIVQG
jgi:alkaline phosphatase